MLEKLTPKSQHWETPLGSSPALGCWTAIELGHLKTSFLKQLYWILSDCTENVLKRAKIKQKYSTQHLVGQAPEHRLKYTTSVYKNKKIALLIIMESKIDLNLPKTVLLQLLDNFGHFLRKCNNCDITLVIYIVLFIYVYSNILVIGSVIDRSKNVVILTWATATATFISSFLLLPSSCSKQ